MPGARKKDEMGKTYGRLTVIGEGNRLGAQITWICRCQCGAIYTARGNHLRAGITRSCGCLRTDENKSRKGHKNNLKNEAGKTYGLLKVIEYAGKIGNKNKHNYWKCLCQGCGKYVNVIGHSLRAGITKNCHACGIKRRDEERKKTT